MLKYKINFYFIFILIQQIITMKKLLAICLLATASLTAVSVSAFNNDVNSETNIETVAQNQVPCDTVPCTPCDTTICAPAPCAPAPCVPMGC